MNSRRTRKITNWNRSTTPNLQYKRRAKVAGFEHLHPNLGFDDFGIMELPRKKVKPTYRAIDSEWEPTKKYE